MKLVTFIAAIFLGIGSLGLQSALGQSLSQKDSLLINKTHRIVQRFLKDKVEGHNYIVYASPLIQLVFIQQSANVYDEYCIRIDTISKHWVRQIEPFDIISRKIFDSTLYHQDSIIHRPIVDRGSGGGDTLDTYFCYVDSNGKRSGQLLSTITTLPWNIDDGDYIGKVMFVKMTSHIQNPLGWYGWSDAKWIARENNVYSRWSIKEAERILKENRKAVDQYNKATKPERRDAKKRRAEYNRECKRRQREIAREERQERRALKQAQKSR